MRFTRITRQEKIDYLLGNPNFVELMRASRRILRPQDMSTAQLTRYVAGARRYESEGRWASDLAEWRGHTASEGHRGRGRKKGMENWTPPERAKRMFWQPIRYAVLARQHRETRTAFFTVTAGETIAVRALAKAARLGLSVAFRLSGPLPGEARYIFWKGGYKADTLLLAAGYKRTRRGNYLRQRGTPGLERWLLDYLTKLQGSPTKERWPLIALYQIFAKEFVDEADIEPEGHRRHYYFGGALEGYEVTVAEPYLITPPHHPWTRKRRGG